MTDILTPPQPPIRRRHHHHHRTTTPALSSLLYNNQRQIKPCILIVLASMTLFSLGLLLTLISQHKKSAAVSLRSSSSSGNDSNNMDNNNINCPHGNELTWHGGHPAENKPGSCWCGQDSYCMCTPSLAIDIVLYQKRSSAAATSEESNERNNNQEYYDVWVVRRSDTNQLATIGGFVDVGETTENAVVREVQEETGIIIPLPLLSSHDNSNSGNSNKPAIQLIGVYSDPRRDNRRHIVSVAYALEFIPSVMTTNDNSGIPHAGDDAKDVIAIPLEEIGVKYIGDDWYADHLSILLDFKTQIMTKSGGIDGVVVEEEDRSASGELYGGNVARSTCS